MSVLLKIIGFLIKYGGLIISVVKEVEQFITGTGAEKKESAMQIIRSVFESRGIAWTPEREAMVSGIIDAVVAAFDWLKGKEWIQRTPVKQSVYFTK